ncbi:MAG TPA: carboxypeptidase-like regulatory domain-containing protein, partial [Thermoanaerobaculia bacterium]
MSRAQSLCLLAALVALPVLAAPPEAEKPVNKKTSQAPVTQRIPKSKKQLASASDDDSDKPVNKGHGAIVVGPPVELHISKANGKKFDLRSLPFIPPVKRERPEREEPPVNPVGAQSTVGATSQPVQASAFPPPYRAAAAPAPLANFDGLDFANWGAGHPPDTNGDVGPNYYIQTINTSIGVFRKTDGARVAAFTFNTFMSQGNFGNLCDTDNFGDPVVLYDSFEDRWIISDFAFKLDGSGNVVNPPGSFQCVAVSMNGDPVSGGWNYYSINTSGGLGDYPKLGIWPDGLYMSVNMFNYPNGGAFENTRLYAFNKYQMYAGSPSVQVVSFDLPSDQFTVLPANARLQTGTPPPGSPNYFASVWGFLNSMQIWKFHVDWNNITLSSVTGPFNTTMGFWWEQFSRSGATTAPTPANFLDTLYPRLMVQNQYSNFGGAESLWTSHTVGAGNPTSNLTSAQSAPRYYQVDVTGGAVAANTVQSFTYSPDATVYRYMPSVAVNRAGDMAMGYATSTATANPAIVYAGRLAGDPVNSITQTEQLLFQGTGSQSGTCGTTCTRWGDYSAMTLDPDGCTFWYTNEYYVTSGLNFNTRIGSFKFPSCTPVGAGGTVNGTVTATVGGAAIVGATVSLGARSTTTDASGNYAFQNIPAGLYPSMTAAYPGYNTSTSGSVSVTDGGTSTQNFSLTSASSGNCYTDTTQADFQAGVPTNLDITTTPGDAVLSKPDLLNQSNATVSPT